MVCGISTVRALYTKIDMINLMLTPVNITLFVALLIVQFVTKMLKCCAIIIY